MTIKQGMKVSMVKWTVLEECLAVPLHVAFAFWGSSECERTSLVVCCRCLASHSPVVSHALCDSVLIHATNNTRTFMLRNMNRHILDLL